MVILYLGYPKVCLAIWSTQVHVSCWFEPEIKVWSAKNYMVLRGFDGSILLTTLIRRLDIAVFDKTLENCSD